MPPLPVSLLWKVKAMKKQIFWLILTAFASETALARQVYLCNIGGTMVYTSRPAANCAQPSLPKIGRYGAYVAPQTAENPPTAAKKQQNPSKNKSSAQVNKQTSKTVQTAPTVQTASPASNGQDKRRMILQQELANEQSALAKAQNDLAAARGRNNADLANELNQLIRDRQQNIRALQGELSRMR